MARMDNDKRSDAKRRADMQAKRGRVMANAVALVNDLLDNRVSSGVWIEVTQIGDDSNFFAKVVIDQTEMGHDRVTTISEIAAAHGAKIMLEEIRMNQTSFSRLALWPSDDA